MLPKQTAAGRLFYGLERFGVPVPVRDVSRFWADIQAQGLVGTVAEPLAGKLPNDSVATAVAAVLAGKAGRGRTVCVVSGGNVAARTAAGILAAR